MNVSNKRMYRANSDKVSNAVKILEIGFGNGRQLQLLCECYPGKELYGIDISKDMVAIAKEKLGSAVVSQKLADMGYVNVYEFGGIEDWTGEIVTEEASDNSSGNIRGLVIST